MTFNEAKELFKTARNKSAGKPLELNTRLVKLSDDCYGIQLYNTVVVQIQENGVYILRTSGWYTRTTFKRINKYSPAKVFSRKKTIYCNQAEFQEGIQVYENL